LLTSLATGSMDETFRDICNWKTPGVRAKDD
jgi:hypothetical protein